MTISDRRAGSGPRREGDEGVRTATRMLSEGMLNAGTMLDAVESWASSLQGEYWLVRETIASVLGRIDGLLVPADYRAQVFRHKSGHWTDKAGLIGVEVKASRADFLRGLREGQFERYAQSLAGLYVVTPRTVRTEEIPEGCGHLIVFQHQKHEWKDFRCVCKRSPTFRDAQMDGDTMWRLVFYAIKRIKQERRQQCEQADQRNERIGRVLERRLFAVINQIEGTPP